VRGSNGRPPACKARAAAAFYCGLSLSPVGERGSGPSCCGLFSELYAAPTRSANFARFVFLDPRAETFYADWDRAARETAAILRSAAGRDPYDRDLSDLVGELATQSEAFRTQWAAHNVRFHATAVKHFHHPAVGDLSLSFNRLDIAADHGLTLFTYAAEPGSRSQEALNLLGSWAATIDRAKPARMTDQAEPEREPGEVPKPSTLALLLAVQPSREAVHYRSRPKHSAPHERTALIGVGRLPAVEQTCAEQPSVDVRAG
jgi:MmyB-like transcription regulator ligand binding domain